MYGSMPAIGQVNLAVRFGSDVASFCTGLLSSLLAETVQI